MLILKKAMTLSIIGITLFVLTYSAWNAKRLEALENNDDWLERVQFQYDENDELLITVEQYNFSEQGQGVIQAVYTPVITVYETLDNINQRFRRFFGIDNLPNQLDIQQENDNLYHNLKNVFLEGWDSYSYEELSAYYFDIDSEYRIIYFEWSHSYELRTYQTLFGLRLWSLSTIQLTYDQLDVYNDQYSWV
jgi:hypothetical protein